MGVFVTHSPNSCSVEVSPFREWLFPVINQDRFISASYTLSQMIESTDSTRKGDLHNGEPFVDYESFLTSISIENFRKKRKRRTPEPSSFCVLACCKSNKNKIEWRGSKWGQENAVLTFIGENGVKIYFAPMEGVTDGILRQTHNRIFGGVDVYCLPFHKLTQTFSLLTREQRDISPDENDGLNVLPQALTREADQLSAWLYYVSECGYSCADLNIGCPSPTVTKKGRGSAMLRDLDYLRDFMDRLFSNTLPVQLSVKTRIGYESPDEWPRILGLLNDYPLAHVTIHARTTAEQYSGAVHPEAFALAVQSGIQHPVYNGDLRTVEDIQKLISYCPETEAVMIGRGLLANPALARMINGGSEASENELRDWYIALYEGWKDRFHETLALGRIKKLMEWPVGNDIKRKRLLRRANDIASCIKAIVGT